MVKVRECYGRVFRWESYNPVTTLVERAKVSIHFREQVGAAAAKTLEGNWQNCFDKTVLTNTKNENNRA